MTKFILMDHVAETMTAVVLEEDSESGKIRGLQEAERMLEQAGKAAGEKARTRAFLHDGRIVKKSDTLEEYTQKVEKIKEYIREGHILPGLPASHAQRALFHLQEAPA